jgi:endoglucanase
MNLFKRCSIFLTLSVSTLFAGTIHVNQVGYYPRGVKTAVAVGATGDSFSLVSASSGTVVFTKNLGASASWDASNENTRVADFSEFVTEGEYQIRIAGCDDSYPFKLGSGVNRDLAKASIKAFYYNRASMALDTMYAGKWARPLGHPDNSVLIHSSAASSARPEGTKISSPGGWYDAGDYGKYIVNSGITIHTLLTAFQAFPGFYDTLALNIPESSNSIPDLLDEALYNLKWMLTMQDPADGGVYHKLTTANFSDFIMPQDDKADRYVVQKTTAATLDFAAVTAQASRLFNKYESQLPGFSKSCRDASLKAWNWARANKSIYFNQPSGINTGTYSDNNVSDEFKWAASELYVTTRQDSFFTIAYPSGKLDETYKVPGWDTVATLGLYTLFLSKDSLTSAISFSDVKLALDKFAGKYATVYQGSPYKTTMKSTDFYWGSNSVGANQGIALFLAYMAGNDSYKSAATGMLDYLLGKNPTDYSFVTGIGDKTPMNIHHRPSRADDVVEPVPGFLVGGANPGQQDISSGFTYPSKLPALSYVDYWNSYASNEVAINWNAPMVFLSGAAEALQNENVKVSKNWTRQKQSEIISFKSNKSRVELRIPLGWENGRAVISDLNGRVLEIIGFDKSGIALVNKNFPTQMIVVNVSAENRSAGKCSFTSRFLTGKL